jgi:hypothetical protein
VDEDGTIDKTEWESRLPKSQDGEEQPARPGLDRLKSALQGRGGRKDE